MRDWCQRGLWVAAAFGLTGTAASAAEVDGLFDQLDKSGDGVVTADEISEDRLRFFERLLRVSDADKDGKLTREEYTAAVVPDEAPQAGEREMRRPGGAGNDQYQIPTPEETMKMLDSDGDGKLVREELTDRGRMLVSVMDRLNKEELTIDDLRAARERMMTMRRGGDPNGARGMDGDERMARLRALDTNADGKVTEDELPEEVAERLRPLLASMGGEIDLARMEEFGRRYAGRGADSDRTSESGRMADGERRPRPKIMQMLDADNDGRLSKLEAVALIEKFSEFDANGDGGLDTAELFGPRPEGTFGPRRNGTMSERFERRRADSGEMEGVTEAEGGERTDGEKMNSESEGSDRRPAAGRRDANSVFGRMDKDGDGVLTEDEMPAFLKPRFGQLDKDKDGVITRDEMRRPGQGN